MDRDDLTSDQALNTFHAANDRARPFPEREKRASLYAADSVALLQRAREAGFFLDPTNTEHLDKDDDLAALHPRADFRAFVARLMQKSLAERAAADRG